MRKWIIIAVVAGAIILPATLSAASGPIRSAQIANYTIRNQDIANGQINWRTLTPDLRFYIDGIKAIAKTPGPTGPTGPAGPVGPKGDPGAAAASGYQVINQGTSPSNAPRAYTINCPSNKHVLTGGYDLRDIHGTPDPDISSRPSDNGTGWVVEVETTSGKSTDIFTVNLYAICANVS